MKHQRSAPFSLSLLALVAIVMLVPKISNGNELHDAVRANDDVRVTALLEGGANVDETDYIIGTPLHIAASQGNTEIARLLIDHGANVNAASEQKSSSALHLSARFGDAAMVALLLDSGAEIDLADEYDRTPLHRAAAKGHLDVVRVLLDRGADVGTRDGLSNATPLHQAAHEGHFDIVKMLLDHGAELNARDHSGWTPFRYAALPQSYSIIGSGALLEYLVQQGADPNDVDYSGLSALSYAELQIRNGDVFFVDIAGVLRDLGAEN